jgi:eukaryotic-like serine/threonine-protein kinase
MAQGRDTAGQPRSPSTFGLHFDVLAQIAVGSTARVDLCRSAGPRDVGQLLAVKRLLPELLDDDALAKRFLDEVWMTAALRHPNVVGVLGWGQDEEGPYLAVELVQGVSLARLSKSVFETGEQFPERLVVFIGLSVARGLGAAHELRSERGEHLGLVHRDLTAGNVLLGFGGEVKIADFGLAKAKDRLTVTTSELPKRSMGHVSPEELEQRVVDHRSDFFALGVLLYEALTGKPPFRGKDDVDVLQGILRRAPQDPAVLRPKVDRALSQLVLACLEKQPEARPQSARAIAATLEEWLYKRGYLADSVEALGRFVRRNSMRQMRWFERAIAGEPEPVPGHFKPPQNSLYQDPGSPRAPLPSMVTAASQNETTIVDGRRAPAPPPRRARTSSDGAAAVRRRRDSSPGFLSDDKLLAGVPSLAVEDEAEDAPTIALRVDPSLRQQMQEALRDKGKAAARASGAKPVAPGSAPPPASSTVPPSSAPPPRPPLPTMPLDLEDPETADSVSATLRRQPVAPAASAAAPTAAPAAPPAAPPPQGQASGERKRSVSILEHIENELALLRALARERHEAARVARQAAHEAAVRAEQSESDARAVERALAGARQAMELASRGDPTGAKKKLEEAFGDLAKKPTT